VLIVIPEPEVIEIEVENAGVREIPEVHPTVREA
jgi:hypothetical protein